MQRRRQNQSLLLNRQYPQRPQSPHLDSVPPSRDLLHKTIFLICLPLPTQTSLPAESSTSSAPTQRTLSTLAHLLLRHPSRYLRQFLSLLQDLSQDDSFLRTLLFALALIVALLRRDVRTRLRLAIALGK